MSQKCDAGIRHRGEHVALNDEILRQIDELLDRYRKLRSHSQYSDCSDLPELEVTSLITLMGDAINRFSPPNSQYSESMRSILKIYGVENGPSVPRVAGVLDALREAYKAGYLTTVQGLIQAEIFADFVEMAEYLLSGGYKDPAAVIIGSVLEEHLRQLCAKNGIAVEVGGKPKKADQLNADLAGGSVYSKLDQKSITGWLDLRNKAAHGKYAEYAKEQVSLQLEGVRNFMVRIPA
jgi:hypothetical protein